jgi:cyanophycin synthetase
LLFDPSVEAAIMECAADDILRHGLAFRACDVTAVLDLNPPEGITRPVSAADHARASRVVVQAATRALVLNADDALCLTLSEASQTRRLCLISVRPENQTVAAHVAAGGLAAVLAGSAPGALILYDSGKTVLELSKIATGLGSGPGRGFAYSALCAAASAYVLGVGVDRIRDIFLSDVLISASGRENLRAQ